MFISNRTFIIGGIFSGLIITLAIGIIISFVKDADADPNRLADPVDEVIMTISSDLPEETRKNVAASIATEIGGSIISSDLDLNMYLLKVPTNNFRELDSLIDRLSRDSRIGFVVRNMRVVPDILPE